MLSSSDRNLQVSVRYFTVLREIVGKKEETIEFREGEKATLTLLLKHLSKKHGKKFDEYVFDPKTGECKGFLQFLVNGRSPSADREFDTLLTNGDIIAILPPVSGG
jgi:MoaD family protein